MPARFTEEDAARLQLGQRRGEQPSAAKAPKPRRKRTRSAGERDLEMQLRAWQITGWTTEFKFDAGTGGRGWRLDFCWPALKLAVEVDGGVHRIAGRFEGDIERHNALALAGWLHLRFSPEQCKSGEAVATIKAALAAREEA